MAAQGLIRACLCDRSVTFQVQGQVTMQQCPAIRQFADTCFANCITHVYIDLCGCSYVDSTFLGTMVYLKRTASAAGGQFALINPSNECQQFIRQTHLDGVFPVLKVSDCVDGVWTELKGAPADLAVFQRGVVQAHQELAEVPGRCGETFRPLADRMTRELQVQSKPRS